ERAGGSVAQAAFGDTIHIALDTFSQLDTNASGIGSGGLNITFTGGDQRLFQDNVSLEGAPPGPLWVGLDVHSDSKISASANASFSGDLTLTSEVTASKDPVVNEGLLADANSGITLTGAHLTASGNVTLTAHSAVSVDTTGADKGDTSDSGLASKITKPFQDAINKNLGSFIHDVSLVTSFSSATIDIGGGSVLSATSGNMSLNATVDGALKASAVSNDAFKITIIAGHADPEILIHGTS